MFGFLIKLGLAAIGLYALLWIGIVVCVAIAGIVCIIFEEWI